jgi:hypothetical protein
MKNKNKGFNPTETKKAIQAKMASFEERLFKAPNDFELAKVLAEMAAVLRAEIDAWLLRVAEGEGKALKVVKTVINAADAIEDAIGIDKGEDHKTLIDRAAKFIGEFEELLQTIREQYDQIYPKAKEIERVYVNTKKIDAPILKADL